MSVLAENEPQEKEAREVFRLGRKNKLEVPRDLLPGTGQQRITRSRLHQPTAKGDDNCQRSITNLSFSCYLPDEHSRSI